MNKQLFFVITLFSVYAPVMSMDLVLSAQTIGEEGYSIFPTEVISIIGKDADFLSLMQLAQTCRGLYWGCNAQSKGVGFSGIKYRDIPLGSFNNLRQNLTSNSELCTKLLHHLCKENETVYNNVWKLHAAERDEEACAFFKIKPQFFCEKKDRLARYSGFFIAEYSQQKTIYPQLIELIKKSDIALVKNILNKHDQFEVLMRDTTLFCEDNNVLRTLCEIEDSVVLFTFLNVNKQCCNAALKLLCKYKKFDLVKKLVEEHEFTIEESSSAISCAIEKTDFPGASCDDPYEIVAFLLERGAADTTRFGRTALHGASNRGFIKTMNLLCPEYIDVNMIGWRNNTALHYACFSSNIEAVEWLLKKGANINARNKNNEIPLHIACYTGNSDTVKLLLESGADSNARDDTEETPLIMMCRSHDSYLIYTSTIIKIPNILKKIDFLLSYNADINARNKNNETALDVAYKEDNQKVLNLLLKNGAKRNRELIADMSFYDRYYKKMRNISGWIFLIAVVGYFYQWYYE